MLESQLTTEETKTPAEKSQKYGEWSAWSECFNSDCNHVGYKIRKRVCLSSTSVCSGNSSEMTSCTSNRCNSRKYWSVSIDSNSGLIDLTFCDLELICTFDHAGEPFCNYNLSSSTSSYGFELRQYKSPNRFTGPASDYPTKSELEVIVA